MSLISKVLALKASIQGTAAGAQQLNQESQPGGGATPESTAPGPNSESSALMNPAALNEPAPAIYRAKFATTAGDFTVEVTRAWAPLGADRFYNLVKNDFFTDAAFFRYVPGFIVQWGIPADPKVAAAWRSAHISDDPFNKSNARGTVTFATAGPFTRTTQLFINLRDNSSLDPQGFTPFGAVIDGMDVVQRLYSGYGEKPDQASIQNQGKAYLDKKFPKLDTIKSATILL
ncbi:MAG: peptidylprolyl isomerase [Bryobacteraceae bacterium]|jgi:peptidyl-prolyl cis-trans isomerase A (cyclophilin A)